MPRKRASDRELAEIVLAAERVLNEHRQMDCTGGGEYECPTCNEARCALHETRDRALAEAWNPACWDRPVLLAEIYADALTHPDEFGGQASAMAGAVRRRFYALTGHALTDAASADDYTEHIDERRHEREED